MRSPLLNAIQKNNKENLHNIWTLCFFAILLVGFFAFDEIMSVIPTAQGEAVILYPGDSNWDKNFITGSLDDPGSVLASDGINLFVGGSFEFGGSTELNKIGYWDGTAWQEMDGGLTDESGWVNAIAVSGDNVFVGGDFYSVGSNPGLPVNNIALWSKEMGEWSVLDSGVDGGIQAIAASSTDVYAGGYFGSASGIPTNGLARWNFVASDWFAFGGLNSYASVNSIAVDGDNVYIAGNFTEVDGQPASNAAYWDGTDWHAMGSDNLQLRQIKANNGQVFAIADIYEGSYPYNSEIMVWNGTTWAELDPMPEGYNGDLIFLPGEALTLAITNEQTNQREVYQWNTDNSSFDLLVELPNGLWARMIFHGANLVASGDLKNSDNPCVGNLASWDGSQWTSIGTANQTVNDTVLSVVGPSENSLYLGGRFSCASGVDARLVSYWDGTGLEPVGDGLSGDFARLVWDNTKSRLYAAGHFTADQNPEVSDVAYLDENEDWTAVGGAFSPSSLGVDAIAVSGDTVIIAQHVSSDEHDDTSQIFALQEGAWQPLGGVVDGIINSLAIMGNNIYAGGDFGKIGDVNLNYIARWDGTAWTSLGSGTNRFVNSLAVSGNNLLVGGDFYAANGDTNLNSLARWDGASWHSIGDFKSSVVSKIAIYGNNIYVAYDNWGSEAIISRWDGTTWSPISHVNVSWNEHDKGVEDLSVYNGSIFVGGNFTTAGDSPSNHFAWWHSPIIQGRVTSGSTPLSGVTIVTRDGHSAITDENGNYTLTGASMGSSFSAVKPGYTFQPPFLTVNDANIDRNISGQNFSGVAPTAVPPKPTTTVAPTQAPVKPAPGVTSLSVTSGTTSLGIAVDITGSNFQPIPVVRLGEYLLTNVRYIDSSHLSGVLPALPGTGYYALAITNPDRQSATLQNAFHQTALIPLVKGFGPNYGYNRFSNTLNIYGSGFKADSKVVLIDSSSVDHILQTKYISISSLNASIPAQLAAGAYSLRVDNPTPDAQSSAVASMTYQSLAGSYDTIYTVRNGIWQSPVALVARTTGEIGITLHRAGGDTPARDLTVAFYAGSVQPANKIGEGNIAVLAPNQSASIAPVTWTAPEAGEHTIVARLDPDGSFANAYPDIDLPSGDISQTIIVLPKKEDTVPPEIWQFSINADGNKVTDSLDATLHTGVTDANPSSGIASLYFVESTYSQSAGTWSSVATSGWIPAGMNNYPWKLSPESGMKYVQVWAADYRGNVSVPARDWINYIPSLETLDEGMTRAYRYSLTSGQQFYASITGDAPGETGDADLYLWGEVDGVSTLLAWSDRPFGEADTILYTAPEEGMDLHLEVFGFTATDYSLSVDILDKAIEPSASISETQIQDFSSSSKEVPAAPAIITASVPVDQVSLPAAPVSETQYYIFLPNVRRLDDRLYTLSGQIKNSAGAAVSGITLQTNTGVTAKTGTDGAYTLTGLNVGTYTITAQESTWYSFNPASKSVTVSANTSNIDFTALPKSGDYITNGGFEGTSGWEITSTAILAAYSTREHHNGSRSMEAGLFSGATNKQGYAKFRQTVPIPASVKSAQLTFWLYPVSSSTSTNDSQYVMILDDKGNALDYLVPEMSHNDKTWIKYQFSLSKYAGKSIQIVFGVYNNGTGGITGMLIDDVSLIVTP